MGCENRWGSPAKPAAAYIASICARIACKRCWFPAVLISVIGFVESVSVAQTLAAKKRQRIDPDQELIGLGAANIGAAFTGGYPVTGGICAISRQFRCWR